MFIKLKDNKGVIKYAREEISDIASAFYRNLYMDNRVMENKSWQNMVINKDSTPPFLKEEIANVLHDLKSNKASGPYAIENETLKILAKKLADPLTNMFNKILITGITQWNVSKIILLHKKGDRAEVENYRPISLSSNIEKIFMKTLKNRIYHTLRLVQTMEHVLRHSLTRQPRT